MKIAVIGKGGHSKVVCEICQLNQHQIIGFFDDQFKEISLQNGQYHAPIYAVEELLQRFPEVKLVVAAGNNQERKKLVRFLELPGNVYMTLIHPAATISTSARIGTGTVVMANAVIQADAEIGNHAIINTSAVIEHDVNIADYVHVSPGAILTGAVKAGEGAHIGAGAAIIPQIEIGEWAVIGAGATVIRPVNAFATTVGTPARELAADTREKCPPTREI
ncbi:acetyltransferase [Bacillaceae bacterium Marseille-Q3522]|nr:acetyltransferase [Bacillaceae bacterium Marseille-Q3522]